MQSKGTQPVYFDDMKVTHTHSPIVSKDDYYPFGLTFGSYARAASVGQNFKFGGKEEQQDWQVFDFEARMYDAVLGRFNSVDPHGDFYEMVTPYNYAFNNPLLFTDPTGMDNTIYLIAAGDMDTKEAQAAADIANKIFEELGLETTVTVYDSEANGEFDADNLDETDNWAVIGEDRKDIVDTASKIDSEWTDHLEDGTRPWSSRDNPETSNKGKSGDKKGILIDHKNNLNKDVNGITATEGSGWSLIHGAGHSAKKIYDQMSNSGEYGHTNSGIMQGGNDMAADVDRNGKQSITNPGNNQIYIEAIQQRYGTNKSTDNYQKNKNGK
ncbi:MAG: RHS repeat-associated core domain-containing protein [Reichenbachiella sp.]|uniref:RHS repeat domain-containing protein n=1 Tax=Reichenbachiella sp. TaxID=2184521 RepID=UPI0032647C59